MNTFPPRWVLIATMTGIVGGGAGIALALVLLLTGNLTAALYTLCPAAVFATLSLIGPIFYPLNGK